MPPTICHLCDFTPVVPGTFLDSLLALAAASRARLGASSLFVFPAVVASRPWLERIRQAGCGCICATPGEAVRRLQGDLGPQDPVILHSHFVGYDFAAFLLKLRAPRTVRLILHLHSYPDRMSWRQHVKDLLKVRLLGRWLCDRSIAVSRSVEIRARRRGFAPDRLVLIENGIDLARFAPDPTLRAEARASIGLDPRAAVVLLLGRDPVLKGVDLYLEAARSIVAAGGEGLFCLVGREETRAFAEQQRAGLGARLRLLEPVADFPRLLNAVDVFVSASRREGLPYAILEAMANERLVIASEIEGAASYGRAPGVWLFPIGQANRLADLLGRALDLADAERRALGRANRTFAEAHFSLDRWAEQVVGVYAEALGS